MANDVTSQRVPWIALALSFLSAGVGHVYCGRIAKGLPLYFAWMLVPLAGIFAAVNRPSGLGLALLLLPVFVVLILYVYAALDAWFLARQIGADYALQDFNRPAVYWLLIVVQFLFSVGLNAGVYGFVYEAFLIPSKSMSPTILAGDRVLARKMLPRDYFPERGELIVYRNPTNSQASSFVGRVVAVAGDRVKITGERILINGSELERDRVPAESLKGFGRHVNGKVAYEENAGRRYLVTYGDIANDAEPRKDFEGVVPERHVFVLGDNRDRSNDSRNFGEVHAGDILGCVDYIYWPAASWSRFGLAGGARL